MHPVVEMGAMVGWGSPCLSTHVDWLMSGQGVVLQRGSLQNVGKKGKKQYLALSSVPALAELVWTLDLGNLHHRTVLKTNWK